MSLRYFLVLAQELNFARAAARLGMAQPALSARKPGSTNFLAWWDGDPVRELLDGSTSTSTAPAAPAGY